MSKFQQQVFTVGSNTKEAYKKYVDNYDAVFGKKKRKRKAKRDGQNVKSRER